MQVFKDTVIHYNNSKLPEIKKMIVTMAHLAAKCQDDDLEQ